MKYAEKKYRVDDFVAVKRKLETFGAKKENQVTTTHYYARHEGNNVTKLVEYDDHNEIHILQESKGKFTLKENTPVKNVEAGLKWLRDKGYTTLDVVKMVYVDYRYKEGTVGLYVINDFLHSVILDFPEQQHDVIEKQFGLSTAEVISIPYNKYLQRVGQIKSIKL